MSDDRIQGAGRKLSGSLKQGIGKLTGDRALQAEGAAEKTMGAVQNAAGRAEDHVRDALAGDAPVAVDAGTAHDRAEGAGKRTAGGVKEGVGALTGDETLQAQGRAQKAEGSIQETLAKVEDAFTDAVRRDLKR